MSKPAHKLQACACGRLISTCRCTGPHGIEFVSTVCATCAPGNNTKVLSDLRVRLPKRLYMGGRAVNLDADQMHFSGFETEAEATAARSVFSELLGFMGPMLSQDESGRINMETSGDVILVGTLRRADDGTFYFTVSVLS